MGPVTDLVLWKNYLLKYVSHKITSGLLLYIFVKLLSLSHRFIVNKLNAKVQTKSLDPVSVS